MCRPEPVRGGSGPQIMRCGRGRPPAMSTTLTGRALAAGTSDAVLFCFVVYNKCFWETSPEARHTRPPQGPTVARHGPDGPGPRESRQNCSHGPGWRGAAWAWPAHKHRGGRCARGAEVSLRQRSALISAFARDGIGQPVVGADSSKKGAFRKARAPPRQRCARPALSTR